MPPPTGHAAGQPVGHSVKRVGNSLGRDNTQKYCRDGDTKALHEDGSVLPALDAGEVALLGATVHGVSDSGSNGTADHGQEQTSDRQRDGDGDGRGNGLGRISGAAVEGEHHDDRRSDRGQSGVRRDGGADVSPAKGHHLERTAQEDALLKVTRLRDR